MAPPVTDEIVSEAERLLSALTPEPHVVHRYEHGGGRVYREVPRPEPNYRGDTDRTLIADYYHVGDREFHIAAPQLVRQLIDALKGARLAAGAEPPRSERAITYRHAFKAGYLAACEDNGGEYEDSPVAESWVAWRDVHGLADDAPRKAATASPSEP